MDQLESQAVLTYHGSPLPNDAKLVIPTWIVALVAVAQAALFLWQLNSMREGMLDATLAANAAKISADAANKAAEISFTDLRFTAAPPERISELRQGSGWAFHETSRLIR
jgi:hypothetical protein